MNVLELFAGSRSIGKEAERQGMSVYSSDINDFKGIDYVVDINEFDVREVPLSRKPGFSKNKLSDALAAVSIKYIHVKDLGSPSSLREKLKHDGDNEYFIEKYSEYLMTRMNIIESLYEYTIIKETSCLMCMERNPDHCHRRIIAEKLMKIGNNHLQVVHI